MWGRSGGRGEGAEAGRVRSMQGEGVVGSVAYKVGRGQCSACGGCYVDVGGVPSFWFE